MALGPHPAQPQYSCLFWARGSWGQAEMNLWTSSSEKGARAFFTLGCMGWRTLSKQVPDDKEGEGKAAAIMEAHYWVLTVFQAQEVPITGPWSNLGLHSATVLYCLLGRAWDQDICGIPSSTSRRRSSPTLCWVCPAQPFSSGVHERIKPYKRWFECLVPRFSQWWCIEPF